MIPIISNIKIPYLLDKFIASEKLQNAIPRTFRDVKKARTDALHTGDLFSSLSLVDGKPGQFVYDDKTFRFLYSAGFVHKVHFIYYGSVIYLLQYEQEKDRWAELFNYVVEPSIQELSEENIRKVVNRTKSDIKHLAPSISSDSIVHKMMLR